jgi:RHH-type proline utilization regulon transcriptional repressor/proline dehydrogenase/delta 1-pyrroline-5-carboxylate dehydrogenase
LLQVETAIAAGNSVVCIVEAFNPQLMTLAESHDRVQILVGQLDPEALHKAMGFHAVVWQGTCDMARRYRMALAERGGALIPLIVEAGQVERYQLERHLCVDTTAAGGNASLIAQTE